MSRLSAMRVSAIDHLLSDVTKAGADCASRTRSAGLEGRYPPPGNPRFGADSKDSNPRPAAYRAAALPTELYQRDCWAPVCSRLPGILVRGTRGGVAADRTLPAAAVNRPPTYARHQRVMRSQNAGFGIGGWRGCEAASATCHCLSGSTPSARPLGKRSRLSRPAVTPEKQKPHTVSDAGLSSRGISPTS